MKPKKSTTPKKKGGERFGVGGKSDLPNKAPRIENPKNLAELQDLIRATVDFVALSERWYRQAKKGDRKAERLLKELESHYRNNPEVLEFLKKGKMKAGMS